MIADCLWPGRWPWRFRRMVGIGYRRPSAPMTRAWPTPTIRSTTCTTRITPRAYARRRAAYGGRADRRRAWRGRPRDRALCGDWRFTLDLFDEGLRQRWFADEPCRPSQWTTPRDYDVGRRRDRRRAVVLDRAAAGVDATSRAAPGTRAASTERRRRDGRGRCCASAPRTTQARVFLNGQCLGSHRGGSTPFFVELTAQLVPGPGNRLQIQVDNRREPRPRADAPLRLVQPRRALPRGRAAATAAGLHPGRRPAARARRVAVAAALRGRAVRRSGRGLRDRDPGAGLPPPVPGDRRARRGGARRRAAAVVAVVARRSTTSSSAAPGTPCASASASAKCASTARGCCSTASPSASRASACTRTTRGSARCRPKPTCAGASPTRGSSGATSCASSHYPHHEHVARIADEVGFMLWEEIPVYWAIEFDDPATLADARNQLQELDPSRPQPRLGDPVGRRQRERGHRRALPFHARARRRPRGRPIRPGSSAPPASSTARRFGSRTGWPSTST